MFVCEAAVQLASPHVHTSQSDYSLVICVLNGNTSTYLLFCRLVSPVNEEEMCASFISPVHVCVC